MLVIIVDKDLELNALGPYLHKLYIIEKLSFLENDYILCGVVTAGERVEYQSTIW